MSRCYFCNFCSLLSSLIVKFHSFSKLCLCLVLDILLFIKTTIPKMFCDVPISNTNSLLGLFLALLFCNNSKNDIHPLTLLCQNMFLHKSSPMLMVICDHTFCPFGGIAKIVCLGNRMANYTTNGLNNSKGHLAIVIDFFKMLRKSKHVVKDPRLLIQSKSLIPPLQHLLLGLGC